MSTRVPQESRVNFIKHMRTVTSVIIIIIIITNMVDLGMWICIHRKLLVPTMASHDLGIARDRRITIVDKSLRRTTILAKEALLHHSVEEEIPQRTIMPVVLLNLPTKEVVEAPHIGWKIVRLVISKLGLFLQRRRRLRYVRYHTISTILCINTIKPRK